jgi:electron transfer flavoprotein alpha subunit
VGETKLLDIDRAQQMLEGPLSEQIAQALAIMQDRQALVSASQTAAGSVAPTVTNPTECIVVLLEPGREGSAQELLGAASQIAGQIAANVTAIQPDATDPIPSETLSAWGADHIVNLQNSAVAEDVARFVADWCPEPGPWSILAPSTTWGREVASRVAARLRAGLTGDAIELEVDGHKLVSWKPAFGGRLVAAIRASSPTQMVTVRPGVLPRLTPRKASAASVETHAIEPRSRFRLVEHQQKDQLDALALATRVVGIGVGIPPSDYDKLDPLLQVLQAELATTRKVTDKGWLPHSRQVGITGRSIAPNLYIALAVGGKFNHTCGIQASGTVLAVNSDPKAPIFNYADIGIVADWAECVPLLVEAFEDVLAPPAPSPAD